jgi:hypothetical protein
LSMPSDVCYWLLADSFAMSDLCLLYPGGLN